MKASLVICVLMVIFSMARLNAQSQPDTPVSQDRKHSVEFNLIWPFVPEIYQIKYGRVIFKGDHGTKGELISSMNYRPWAFDDDEGDKTMFAVAVGYRHYWWKGLNSELAIYPEFVRIRNNVVDGQDHSDFYIVPEFYSGYKGNIGKKGFFYNVQLGIGRVIFPDESYPRSEENRLFFNGNMTIGLSF